jgi:hypothetical protein
MVREWKAGLTPLNSRVSLGSQSRLPISRCFRRTRPWVPSGLVNSGMRTLTSMVRVTVLPAAMGMLLEHQAAGFGADGGGGFLAAELHRDAIVAGRNRDGEEEGFIGRSEQMPLAMVGTVFRSQPADLSESKGRRGKRGCAGS